MTKVLLKKPAAARNALLKRPDIARLKRQQKMPLSEDSSTGLQTPASAMVHIFQPAATINVSDLSETERESTAPAPKRRRNSASNKKKTQTEEEPNVPAPATPQAEDEFTAPAPATPQAKDETAADTDGEAANDADIDETADDIDFEAANDAEDKNTADIDEKSAAEVDETTADIDGEVGRGHEPDLEELFDPRPLTAKTLQQHRDSLPNRQPSRATSTALQGKAADFSSENAPSVSSLLDTLPPGSEAGLSFATTMDTFDARTATRSQASTRSCGNQEEILPLCAKCGYPTEVFNSRVYTKATATKCAKYVCRPCNNIQTMVYRNIKQEGSLKMSSWNNDQLNEFFRQALEEQQQHQRDGRSCWQQIREVLKKCLVKRYIEKTKKQIKSEFKPLGVWKELGYDVEMIAAFNKTEWNPACGMCYAVPLKSICWSKQEEEIEEHIAKAEFQRGPQKEAGADESCSEENTSPANGREAKRRKLEVDKAKEAAEAAKEAKKEQAKEEAAVKSHNSKMHILASKTVTALSTGCESLKKVAQSRNFRSAPTFLAEKIKGDVDTSVGYLKEADNVLKLMKKCAKDGSRLPEISFTVKDLSDMCRAFKKGKTDFEAFEKLCRNQ